jgi:uncharacterized protein (TIGR01244 family)
MAEAARQGFAASSTTGPTSNTGPTSPPAREMQAAARTAGLEYRHLPVDGAYQSPEADRGLRPLLQELPRPLLAFCRSGARSTRLYNAAQGALSGRSAATCRPGPRPPAIGVSLLSRPSARRLKSAGSPDGETLKFLLQTVARSSTRMNEMLGKLIMWLVLAAVLISAGNAIVRKAFNIGSNALLEIQWYLFSGGVHAGRGLRDAAQRPRAHRLHLVKLSKRTNAIIDAIGIVVFTIPLSIIMIDLGWPLFERAWTPAR